MASGVPDPDPGIKPSEAFPGAGKLPLTDLTRSLPRLVEGEEEDDSRR